MKKFVNCLACCLLFCAFLISATHAQDQSRTWEDATGSFRIDAVLLDHNDQVVRLKKSDGRVVNVPLDKLSKKDRDFIANLKPKSPDNPFAGGVKPVMDRKIAQILQSATTFRFDASDLMPGAVGAGSFWTGMTDLVNNPDANVDRVLDSIDKSWPR